MPRKSSWGLRRQDRLTIVCLFGLLATITWSVVPTMPPACTPETWRLPVNTATCEELQTLPDIGERRARLIYQYRLQHGPYRSWEELSHVPGIGPKLRVQISMFATLE